MGEQTYIGDNNDGNPLYIDFEGLRKKQDFDNELFFGRILSGYDEDGTMIYLDTNKERNFKIKNKEIVYL